MTKDGGLTATRPGPLRTLGAVVATKVQPPPSGHTIARPRLTPDTLHASRVAVIKAPPGFGKTSLGLAWFEQLHQEGAATAWVTLDPEDDEPTRFLHYASEAVRRASGGRCSSAVDLLSEAAFAQPRSIISALLNDLLEYQEELFLFLDDYHVIQDKTVSDALSFLLNYAPANFHLVLLTRTNPDLPLARLRVQGQLIEIEASTLRFDLEETRRFFAVEHPSLDPSEARLLHATTDGWAAAMRLASISLRQQKHPRAYLRSLSTSARPIVAYIAEMLATLPAEMVRFMVRTAILDRLNAPLCEAVTGLATSRSMLKEMEERRLLLIPLDQEGDWYRYHALLADHLRQVVQTELGAEVPSLHRHAYWWFASRHQWTEAVRHAIAAGDTEQALAWVNNCAMSLVTKGDLLTVLGWHRQFPVELIRRQPSVQLALAWGMALAMRASEALSLLANIDEELARTPWQSETVRWECQILKSVIAALGDDSAGALSTAQNCWNSRALDEAAGGQGTPNAWNINVLTNVLRFGYWKAGDLTSFYAVPWIPFSPEQEATNVLASVYRLCLMGLVEAQQGHLEAAGNLYAEASHIAVQHGGPKSASAAMAAGLAAELLYEGGRLDEAELSVVDHLEGINSTALHESVLRAYTVLARISSSRGNTVRTLAILEQGVSLARGRAWARVVAGLQMERLKVCAQSDRLAEARACLSELQHLEAENASEIRCSRSEIRTFAEWGRACLAFHQGQHREVIEALMPLAEQEERLGHVYAGIRIGVLLACALCAAGQAGKALDTIFRVLEVGDQVGAYRSILDEGPLIFELLGTARAHTASAGNRPVLLAYIDRLLEGKSDPQHGPAGMPSLHGPNMLTPREQTVLHLIAEGRSNKEVARDLGIAPETVKTHVKNVFVKLSVETRAQAIARAQSFGLLRTD
jgi:LuxR family maltose regulon positive regulatory protein